MVVLKTKKLDGTSGQLQAYSLPLTPFVCQWIALRFTTRSFLVWSLLVITPSGTLHCILDL